MIGVLYPATGAFAGGIVTAALRRSVTRSQVTPVALHVLRASPEAVSMLVVVDMPEAWSDDVLAWLAGGRRKLVVFGRLPWPLAQLCGWCAVEAPPGIDEAARSEPAPAGAWGASAAAVRYTPAANALGAPDVVRHFERFDFTDEWNNLGYGAIRADDSCWGIGQWLDAAGGAPGATAGELAVVEIAGARAASYAALAERDAASILWFARTAGPLDSWEWRVVERFLADHRGADLPCQPVWREIPAGYDAAVTSRLDCDEDVESARPLWEAYRALDVPFSLAVHTAVLADERHRPLLNELRAAGGAVLSHTATHAPEWGGSYEAARHEAWLSATLLRDATGHAPRYAVSPFHQTPEFALQALADVGYAGCIGGIIRNDPAFVLARGGELAGLPAGFVGHSQQCMLHGDCLLVQGDPLAVYRQAFDLAYASATLFGYLDHPFSPRYAYGWSGEAGRIAAHEALIGHIRQRASRPLFLNEDAALDFLRQRAGSRVATRGGSEARHVLYPAAGEFGLAVEYRGECLTAEAGMELQ